MRNYKWVSAQDINRWADSVDARGLLPELIRRLVHATIDPKDVEHVNFPSGDETHRPGADGTTRVKSGNAKVPAGVSFWEMGADLNPKKKFDDDYSNRVSKRGTGDFSQAAYVAVTPRDFQNKGKWADEKSALNEWREIRAYDSDDLEQWLEMAPAVGIWLSGYASRRPEGVHDVSTHWANLQGSLRRPLPAAIALTRRQGTIDAITGWLNGPPSALAIRAESPQEVVDVFAAWVASLAPEEQSKIASRAVIIEEVDPWRAFSDSKQPLIMVRAEQLELSPEQVAEAYRKGHHALIPLSLMGPYRDSAHRLERIDRFQLQDCLQHDGKFEEAEARTVAQNAGGSFSILKRKLSAVPLTKTPKWSEGAAAADLAPLLLVGAWNDKFKADKELVAKIAARPYEEVQRILGQWRGAADAPVRWADGIWEFVAPLDAWSLLAPSFTSGQLDAFEEVAKTVLGTDALRYELPKEERWLAQIKGKGPVHSEQIREGLARTMALLAIHGEAGAIADTITGDARVARLVRSIVPAGAKWQRWASLGHLLSTIAEAAPVTLLSAIEADLRSSDPELPKLFAEEGQDFGARAEHTGLLWALERLCWAPEHLSRAALALAKLDERDPGGRIGNRPHASLTDTFCAWMLQTAAPLEKRVETLKLLLDRQPKAGWKLLLALMPELHSAMSSRATPEWRGWAESWKRRITDSQVFRERQAYVRLAINAAEAVPERWADLLPDLGKIFHFSSVDFDAAVAALDRTATGAVSSEQKRRIWVALEELLQKHRASATAPWAMPPTILSTLEAIRPKFKPTDPVDVALPFFKTDYQRFADINLPWEEQEKQRFKARAEALTPLLQLGGLPAVKLLAQQAGDPVGVGVALADVDSGSQEASVLPAFLLCGTKALEDFAFGYAARKVHVGGRPWLGQLPLTDWKAGEAAKVISPLPFDRSTWDYVESLGGPISAAYWRISRYFPPDSVDDVVFVARKLIGAGRPAAAIDLLTLAEHKHISPPNTTVLELFEEALKTPPKEARLLDGYEVDELLVRLRQAADVDESRVARLEWALLPAMSGHERSPETLYRLLSRDPDFFLEILTLGFRQQHRDRSKDEELPENEKQQAKRACQLLMDWHLVPGSQKDGTVDPKALGDWVAATRMKAAEADRKETLDCLLGHAFAHAPADADGSWPCAPVRDVIDNLDSPDLESGFHTECISKRGVYWRSPKEGGRQERALAKEYEGYASLCDSRWPRTAAALRAVAEDYNAQARQVDAEAEADQ